LKTQGGGQLAEKRVLFLQHFVDEIAVEINSTRQGAIEIVWICHEGGKRGLRLFESRDPLALQRKREPERYIVDQLIDNKDYFSFIYCFLEQLQEEICVESNK
jgi:hypothetical protein